MSGARTDRERKAILRKINDAYESSQLIIKEVCREHGICDATYYNWKEKFVLDVAKEDEQNNISVAEKKVIELKKDKPFIG